ncbi:MAG: TonB-dependent receptor plug domain-containing protein [Alistipes sp.]
MKTNTFILWVLLLFCAGNLYAQSKSVGVPFNGLIVNAEGIGVKAKIFIKHSKLYTTSTKEGKFGLTDIKATDTLTIRCQGRTMDIAVDGRKAIKIVWLTTEVSSSEAPELSDYGYGYVKRREIILGNASGISGEKLRQGNFLDLQSAILTLIPGITMINGQFIIRGVSSINSGIGALIVCDGSPVNNLNSINIRDVESVEVQKGANMYGLRGSNGVIIIRTRKQ